MISEKNEWGVIREGDEEAIVVHERGWRVNTGKGGKKGHMMAIKI